MLRRTAKSQWTIILLLAESGSRDPLQASYARLGRRQKTIVCPRLPH
jgi:hypothetical protein